MRVYVAGKTEDIPRVRNVQALVRHTGHTLTYDWTHDVEEHGANISTSQRVREECALKDAKGVYACALLIAVGSPHYMNGTLWECGMAAAWSIPTWLIDWELCPTHSIFEALPNVRLMGIQEVGEELWRFSELRLERQPARMHYPTGLDFPEHYG
jgi:hypothetical protein